MVNATLSDFTPLFGALGAASAIIFTSVGAAIGSAKTGSAIASIAPKRMDLVFKSMIPVVMSGVLPIYGIMMAVVIVNNLSPTMLLYRSLLSLSGGLAVGLTAIASGVAIGVVADSGIKAAAEQSKSFCSMVLTLIFCEALGLYGFVVGLLLCVL
jgi:V-type H+-transporting ATPase proteolipid subunit